MRIIIMKLLLLVFLVSCTLYSPIQSFTFVTTSIRIRDTRTSDTHTRGTRSITMSSTRSKNRRITTIGSSNKNKYQSNNQSNNQFDFKIKRRTRSTTPTIKSVQQHHASSSSTSSLPSTLSSSASSISSKAKSAMSDPTMKFFAMSIPATVILVLAMNNEPMIVTSATYDAIVPAAQQVEGQDIDLLLGNGLKEVEKLERIGATIIDAALPQDATTLVSVTLGESIAGLFGAISTWGVNLGLNMERTKRTNFFENIGSDGTGTGTDDTESSGLEKNAWWEWKGFNGISENDNDNVKANVKTNANINKQSGADNLSTEAVANSDYFLTRAAAAPLFEAVGMSGGLATAATVLLASVPYELIKFSAKAKEQRIQENLYLELLLEEERRKKKSFFQFSSFRSVPTSTIMTKNKEVAQKGDTQMSNDVNIEAPMEMGGYRFDYVELFADICKWLEYDVLTNDFGGQLRWADTGLPVNTGLESAGFGFLAAISSQIYADIIYSFSDSAETQVKREEVKSRTIDDYITIYSVKGLSAATLFGVYETTRVPFTQVINNFLSGGYDSCLGSNDFNLCLETYFFSNPAEATREAQFRSSYVAFINLFDRLNDFSNENVDAAGLIRSLAVQVYSLIGFDLSSIM